MPRRPADPEFCAECARKLREAVVGKMRKKAAAAVLGVSRQMLDVYLKAEATPGPDVLLRAMKAWRFTLKYRGREITSSQLARPPAGETPSTPEQLLLPLREAIEALNEGDLGVRIVRKAPDRIELQVSIKFAG
jgi:hypothetical protein